MSRVDEAMRRAAETSANAEVDTLALAREPFPVEMPDTFRPPAGASEGADPPAPEPPVQAIERSSHATSAEAESAPADPAAERFGEQVAEKIVVDPRMPAVSREQYRRLAAVLHDSQAANRTQVVMVASAVAGEGKTLTAANIALTLSKSYRKRVLVIDGDLRRPALHNVFGVETSSGLADCLASSGDAKIVIRQITPMLSLLPAGRPTTDPMAGLISARMRRLVQESRELFDWVIIDTPPLMLLPDANLLASMADAALLVVRAESTPYTMVKRAMDAIGRAKILGVVLNNATVGPHGGYDGYSDYLYVGSNSAAAAAR
jgi:capsular exopolysaccharide synthesis family protein